MFDRAFGSGFDEKDRSISQLGQASGDDATRRAATDHDDIEALPPLHRCRLQISQRRLAIGVARVITTMQLTEPPPQRSGQGAVSAHQSGCMGPPP